MQELIQARGGYPPAFDAWAEGKSSGWDESERMKSAHFLVLFRLWSLLVWSSQKAKMTLAQESVKLWGWGGHIRGALPAVSSRKPGASRIFLPCGGCGSVWGSPGGMILVSPKKAS